MGWPTGRGLCSLKVPLLWPLCRSWWPASHCSFYESLQHLSLWPCRAPAPGWKQGCGYVRIMLSGLWNFKCGFTPSPNLHKGALGISRAWMCVGVSVCARTSVLVGGARRWGCREAGSRGERQSHRPWRLVLLKMLHLLLYSMTMSKL